MPVSRSAAPAVQFVLVANPALLLTGSQTSKLQQAITGASARLGSLLGRADRAAMLRGVFGNAGRPAAGFNSSLNNLLQALGGSGLGLQVQLRSAAEMNGAAVAYAPRGPGGAPRLYLSAAVLESGISSEQIAWLLLKGAGHNIDSRLNGELDSQGDEGKAFAALLTGRTLSAAEQALLGGEARGGVVTINGSPISVETQPSQTSQTPLPPPPNQAPSLSATASNGSFSEAQGLGSQAAAVAVFSNTTISTGSASEAGQTITRFSLSVAGLRDGANELLWVDGTAIHLGASASGSTAGTLVAGGLAYSVTITTAADGNSSAALSLSKAGGLSTAVAAGVLNALTYQNSNTDNPTAGNRTITITGLSDSGGTASGGSDTSTLNITSTITVIAVNDAPQLGTLAPISLNDTTSADSFAASSGSLVASDPEGGALSYGLDGATDLSGTGGVTFDGITYNRSKAGSYGTLYLNSGTGQYRFQPKSDWSLNALSTSGTDSFTLSVSDGTLISTTSLLVSFSGSQDTPEQYVVVDDGSPLLTASAEALWEQALTNASRYLQELLTRSDRDAILQDAFGRAGTDSNTFQTNLQALLNTIGGTGLRIDVDLRTDTELNGAAAAYAAVGHTGSERIYVNGDKINSGELTVELLTSALLEEYGHAIDLKLNNGVDSPGDEGQLFASEVTGVTLTAEQRAVIDAENDSAILTIEGVQVLVEEAAGTQGQIRVGSSGADTFTTTSTPATTSDDDFIFGGAGADSLVGGAGYDIIIGGLGADTLTGGSVDANTDIYVYRAGDTALTISQGAISGFDIITDFGTNGITGTVVARDLISFAGLNASGTTVGAKYPASTALSGASLVNDSAGLKITAGTTSTSGALTTFTNSASTTVYANNATNLAAIVSFLQNIDIGDAGTTLNFADASTRTKQYIYIQGTDTGSDNTKDILIELSGLSAGSGTLQMDTTSTQSGRISFVTSVDTAAPTVTVSSGSSEATASEAKSSSLISVGSILSGEYVVVTYTGQSGTIYRTFQASATSGSPSALLDADLTTLGNGLVTVEAYTVTDTTTATNINGAVQSAIGSAQFTLDMTVPTFTSATTATVNENVASGSTVYTAAATDNATLTYGVSGTDAGSFTINSGTGVVTINTSPNFEAKSSYTFAVSATDTAGNVSTQNVTLSVNDLNEAPVFSYGTSASFAENATGTAYTGTANDPEGGAVTYSISGTDSALFNIDSSTGIVTFKSVPNFESPSDSGVDNTYNFSVTASDGSLSTSQAVALTVTNVNEAPALGGAAATLAYTENGAAAAIDGNITIADPDSPTSFNGGFLQAAFTTNGSSSDQLSVLNIGTGTGQISVSGTAVSYQGTQIGTIDSASTGVNGVALKINLNSSASSAATQALARAIAFSNSSDNPSTAARTVTFTLNDGGNTGSGGAQTATRTGTVNVTAVNDAPAFTSGITASFAENATGTAYTGTANDPEGGAVTYSISGTDSALFNIDSSTGIVTFKSVPNFESPSDSGVDNTYNFSVTASDGSLSTSQAVALTVTNVNEAPALGGAAATLAYTENGAAAAIDGNITIADPDSPTSFNGGFLQAAFTTNGSSSDQLSVLNIGTGTGQISVSGTAVSYQGTQIGTIDSASTGVNGVALKINLNSSASSAATQALARAIAFSNSSDNPSTAARTVTFTLNDGANSGSGGAQTATRTATVNVTVVNDAPLISDASVSINKTAAAGTTVVNINDARTGNDSDADSTALTYSISSDSSNGGFTINASTGVITVLDATKINVAGGSSSFTLVVAATDGALSDTATITVLLSSSQIGTANADTLSGTTGNDYLDGLAGNDSIDGGAGNDLIEGDTGADTLTGGSGIDSFFNPTGASSISITGTGKNGSISGFDIITDFTLADGNTIGESLRVAPSGTTASIASGGTLNNSSLQFNNGNAVKSHSISNGIATFDDADTFGSAISLTTTGDVAAVVQYLQANDIGNAGATLAFNATISGSAKSYVYTQTADSLGSTGGYGLIEIQGRTLAGLTTSSSTTTNNYLFISNNLAPLGDNDTGSANEAGGVNNATAGTNASGNVLSNDKDVDSSITVTAVRTGSTEGSGSAGTVGTGLSGTYGSLTLNSDGTYSYAINNSNAAVQALSAGSNLSDAFNYTVSDGTLTDTAVLTITINGANDAPTISAPSSFSVTEDIPGNLTFTGSPFVDPDSTNLTVTLSIADGTISATSGSGVTVSGTSIATTFSGTAAALNSFFTTAGNITYTTAQNSSTARLLTISISDGALNSSTTSTVNVTAVNDAPTRTAGSLTAISVSEDSSNSTATSLGLTTVTYGPGGGADEASQTLTYTITAIPSFIQLFKADGTTQVTANSTVTGTELQGLTYKTFADANGSGDITWTVVDSGSGTTPNVNTLSESLSVTVNAVNDAPINSVPAAQTVNEDTPLIFSSANGNLISISDVDAGTSTVQVQLTVTNGTLALSGTSGLTLMAGANNSSTMTYQGTLSALNTALAGLTYSPNANFNGSAQLTIVTSDLGNTGSGGTLTDTDIVNITVNAVNDSPTLTSVSALTGATEDTAFEITYASLLAASNAADVEGTALSFRIENITTGTLEKWTGSAWAAVSAGSTTVATGEKLQWTPAINANGTLNAFTIKAFDGTTYSNSAVQVQVTASAVNDAPTSSASSIDAHADQAYLFVQANFPFTDPDSSWSAVKITSLPGSGKLERWNGTAWSAVAQDQEIIASEAMGGRLRYVPPTGASAANSYSSFTFQVKDNSGASDGSAYSATQTLTINLLSPRGPDQTVPKEFSINEDTPYTFSSGLSISFAAATNSDGLGATVANDVTTTVSIASGFYGSLSISAGVSGGATVTGSGSSLSLRGTVAQINASLAGLIYTPGTNAFGDENISGAGSTYGQISLTTTNNPAIVNGIPQYQFTTDVDTIDINVSPIEDAATGSLSFTGTVAEGATLTAVSSAISDVDGTLSFTYQWQSSANGTDWSNISAATSNTYVIPSDQSLVGKSIRLSAVSTDPFGGTTTFTSTGSQVANVDTVAPSFSSGSSASVNENVAANTVVYHADATDSDFNAPATASSITYSLTGTNAADFAIDASGVVTIKSSPDFETKSSYDFTVLATDAAGNAASKSVALSINNLDEVAPSITSGNTATAINENSGAGQVIYTATTNDTLDISTGVTFSLKNVGDVTAFSINPTSGAVMLSGNPDFETKSSYAFTVTATDTAGNSSEQQVSLAINDLDEIPPEVSITAIGGADGTVSSVSNDNRVVGTAEASRSVSIIYNGSSIGSTSADASGNWTYTLTGANLTTIGQGSGKAITASQTDAAGNTGTSAPFTFAVDTTAPNTPSLALGSGVSGGATALEATQSSGVVTVSAESGSSLLVSFSRGDNTVTRTLTATGASQAVLLSSADLATLGNGSITVSAVATDAAGNSSSASTSFNLDSGAPTLTSLSFGSHDGNLASGESLTLTATLSEAVNVTGTPSLVLNNGGSATYSGGSGSNQLTFTYTPLTGQSTTALTTAASTALRGTITDLAGNSVVASGFNNITPSNGPVAVDAIAPTLTTITYGSNDGALALGETIDLVITGSEALKVTGSPTLVLNSGGTANYVSGSGGNQLHFRYTPGAGQSTTDLATATSNALGGSITDLAGNSITASGFNNINPTGTVVVDSSAPTVSAIAISAAAGAQNGQLNAGDTVTVTVTMSEAVMVDTSSGTPLLSLNVGGSQRSATYSSGSGSSALLFTYTIQASDSDANGISVDADRLSLNGGSIRDLAGNSAASLTHAAVSDNGSYVVNNSLPQVTAISYGTNDGNLAAGEAITLQVGFDETVLVSGTPTLLLNSGGSASYLSGSGSNQLLFRYTPSAGQSTADLATAFSNALSNALGSSITDLAGNAVVVSGFDNIDPSGSVAVDAIAPLVSSLAVSSSTGTTLGTGSIISVTVAMSESVSVSGTPSLTLNLGGAINRTATYVPEASTSTALVFRYTIVADDTGASAISIPANSLANASGSTIRDAAGNDALLSHQAYADGRYVVDASAPTISSLSISSASGAQNGTLNAGDVVFITAAMSEVVNVTGSPQLALNVGGSSRSAAYVSGSGSSSLVFSYTIQSGDSDSDGISITANALTLNGGTIKDAATNVANLLHDAIADQAAYKVDTTVPVVTVVAISAAEGAQNSRLNAGDVVSLSVSLSEAVTISGTPLLTLDIGGTPRSASYVSGSGTASLLFRYTLQTGESDANGISLFADGLALNGGSISDAAGNRATLSFAAVADDNAYRVDAIAPQALFSTTISTDGGISPTINSGGATRDNTLGLSGSASDAGGLSKVEIYSGDTYLGDATLDSNAGTWTYTTPSSPALTDGNHSFTARVTDLAGNVFITSAVNARIDTTAPGKPSISFAIDDVVPGTANVLNSGTTNDNTPTLRVSLQGTAALAGDTVQLLSDDSVVTSATLTSTNITDGYVQLTPTLINDGTYTFTTRLIDVVGNVSQTSAAFSLIIDRQAPTAPSLTLVSDTGSSQTDGITKTGTISVGDLETPTTTWQYSLNGGVTWLRGSGTSFSLPNGRYAAGAVQVRQADLAGNLSPVVSNSSVITVDNTAPTIAISAAKPSLGLVGGNPDTTTITFVLSEAVSFTLNAVSINGSQGTSITDGLSFSDGTLTNLQGSGTIYTASFTPAASINKPVTISVGNSVFSDLAGNSNSDGADANNTVTISVNTIPADASTLPAVAAISLDALSDSGTQADWITNNTNASFTGTLTKALGQGQTLQISKDGSSWVTVTTTNLAFSFSASTLGGLSSSATLQARVFDADSNAYGNTWSRFLTIDTSTYTGSLSLLNYSGSVSNGSAAGNDNSFELSLPNAEPGATISYQRWNGTTWDTLSGASQTSLADGSYRYRAIATDAAANTATSAELSLAIDSTAPMVPTLALNNGVSEPLSKAQLTASNGAILITSFESGATVTLTLSSDALGSSPVIKTFTSSGTTQSVVFSSNDAAVLGDGTLTANVTITDPAGNSSSAVPLSFSYVAQPVTIIGDLSISRTQNGTEAGPTPSLFTLTRTGDLSLALTVNYRLSGTAVAGTGNTGDYIAPALDTNGLGSVSFAAGASTATLSIATIDNTTLNTTARTITATLIKPDTYNLVATASASTATLADNETGIVVPAVSINNISLTEGSGTDWIATADVILSQASTVQVSVNYSFRDGTAAGSGIDYTGYSGNLNFAAGSLRQQISFTIKADTVLEADEDFYIDLSNPSNATLNENGSSAKITITNDDGDTSPFSTPKTLSDPGVLNGADLNDNLTGSSGTDTLSGGGGNDTLTGMLGGDLLTGGTGADIFKYTDYSQSTVSNFDTIADFSISQGDRISILTIPSKLWNLGTISATSLSAALASAYADADRSTSGSRPLASNEAMSFRWGTSISNRATYIVVDNPSSINSADDIIIRVGGLSFSTLGEAAISDIFAAI